MNAMSVVAGVVQIGAVMLGAPLVIGLMRQVRARLEGHEVKTPDGWAALYRAWAEGGWNALAGPEEFGGQALPHSLLVATFEMWNSCAMAFAIGPTLTIGAIEALYAHADDEIRRKYLPKMVSGEWMGSMNLTEPGAGSDLGSMKTRAERRPGQVAPAGNHDHHRW